jgi:hypothetical protein
LPQTLYKTPVTARAARILGIDLGTTHTVVAWAEAHAGARAEVLPLPQLVARGEVQQAPLLPSFLYAPAADEGLADPLGEPPWIVGQLARQRGREVPGRVVTSAKSWLCHAAVDREAPILPWGSGELDVPRLSPVDASARLLRHVARAWHAANPEHALEQQHIVLTVPASFDEVARELTVRAAQAAGLTVRLLEEPQAAFYDYLGRAGSAELEALAAAGGGTALALVVDVGGGTTDLTLIRVSARAGQALELERIAVGRHLLLGGDNIDLALAHWCEARLIEAPDRLDPARFGQLVMACRQAKERLLGPEPPAEVAIRVLGRGSGLVGSTLSLELPQAELERIVFGGFLPDDVGAFRPKRARGGLVAYGLPYESDPAITRHVFEFLERHLPAGHHVGAVLLNGGLFRAERAAERLLDALEKGVGSRPLRLAHADPDLAVARGAVAYGLALAGHGIRIAGGTAHGYYVGVEAGTRTRALCVVPRGAAEGERHVASAEGLAVRIGQPVRFELFASDTAGPHAPGELVDIDDTAYDPLPPLVTELDHDGSGGSELRVALTGELTPVGTVDLGCIEVGADVAGTPRRFRLAFELRSRGEARRSTRPPSGSPKASGGQFEPARAAVERVFGKGRSDVKQREVKDLVRELERLLGERSTWTGEQNRRLFDLLATKHAARRRSADHERVFWMLAGYCLRPGFGHPQDRNRVALLVPLFAQGLAFQDETRSWQQFWIAWRRIAGGLPADAQAAMLDVLVPFLAPQELKLKKPKGFRPQAGDELVELASWLERIAPEQRAELGRWLVERTWTDRDPRLWSAIGRIGARVPAYASVHHVIAPATAERWLDHLLREKWAQMPSAAGAAVQLARVTGDRARDVSERVRGDVARQLERSGAPADSIRAVSELVPVEEAVRREWFGEDLPVGLRLIEL